MSAAVFPGFPKPTDLKWREVRAPRLPGMEKDRRCYVAPDGLVAIVAWAPRHGWHLSLSHDRRYPTWNEIRDARYALLPDECTVGLLLPPRAEYINLHPNCFHLHEVPGDHP